MVDVDTLVIGAGIVGLACAAELARRGDAVLVIERHGGFARETSSRNSGVVHAGLYYPAGSLKALTCVEGRELLYARCARDGVAHRVVGKLIVATTDDEVPTLERLHALGRDNGAGDLALIDGAEVARREPAVRAVAGLVSPRTGIVDVHGLCASYAAEARRHDAELVFRSEVTALERLADGWRVVARGPDGEASIVAARVVNAAGLAADDVARLAGADVPRHRFCKGDYFAIRGARTTGLVYPVPSRAGLGVHVTVDLGGAFRAGPDTEWVDTPRYDVDPAKAAAFGAALRRYLPHVRDEDLAPDYAGVRPKLHAPDEPKADFVIDARDPTMIHLLGIESPGLTAAEALARRVAAAAY
ncbi:MAG: NAD(P)/FAD-dependent oxidoreductase [Myxococcales bacterium]|nr:NAD(P)/FAD-dependent oxidoreductase [Myxococcales bacterium]